MKILMISDVCFPRINGVSSSIETFRESLDALGVKSVLVAPDYAPTQVDTPENDRSILRIPSRRIPFDPEDRLMRRAALDRRLAQLAERQHFDLVHVQTPFAAHYAGVRIARRMRCPVVATYHTYFEEYLHHYIPFLPGGATRSLARRFSRSQCNELDAVIVPSRAMDDTLSAYGVTRPMHIIPTGLREHHFRPGDGAGFRLRHGIPDGRPLLLFVGRVAFEKNIGFLLDAIDRLRRSVPEVLLLITGEGPALPGLQAECERRALSYNVRFMGYLDRSQTLGDCYAAADLFVFASRTETQGLVLLEAMAQGTPVLALSAMGTRDILEDTPGAVIAEDDPAAFSRQAAKLLADMSALRKLGPQARQSAENWRAATMAKRVATLYAGLCQHPKQS